MSKTEAVAALLHDSAEDCGGKPMLEMVRAMFGEDVALIVESCTDTFADPKPEWKPRKEAYIAHLSVASSGAKLVAGCDKLHNLNTTLKDLRKNPSADYWGRFNAGATEQLWYFKACANALSDSPVGDDLQRSCREFESILKARGDI
jgi:(p)ppGpp synthase/HD superfamily hydrolase